MSEANEGLVLNQQSLNVAVEPQKLFGPRQPVRFDLERIKARERASMRRAQKLRDVRPVAVRQKVSRWRAIVEEKASREIIEIDSKKARVRRCQKRVWAWAGALPKQSRKIRRAGRVLNIGPRLVMLTLTYTDADAWEPGQIREFMILMRKSLGSALYGYAWVLEMQERGAPHYHVLLYVKAKTDVPEPDKAGLWLHGLTRRETAKSAHYIAKYTGKEYQKESLPAGARMFAVQIYKNVLDADDLLPFRLSSAPGWLQPHILEAAKTAGSEVRWTRAKGGGWLIKDTGELHQSPYVLIAIEAWRADEV